MYFSAILAGALLILFASPVFSRAESDAVRTLTLKEAIRMALENNHRARAASLNAGAAARSPRIAASRYLPQLFLEENFAASNSPTQTFMMKLDQGRFTQNDFLIDNLNHPGTWRNFKTALTMSQSLYDPTISPSVAMARSESEKAEIGGEEARRETAFQVFVLSLDCMRVKAWLKALEQAKADAVENVRLAGVRQKEGVGLKSDLLRARTYLAGVEQQLITARNNLTLTRLRAALATGAGENVQIEVAGPDSPLSPSCSIEELTGAALRERGDLRQARADLDRGDAAIRLARSAYFPILDIFGSYQFNSREYPFGSDNDAWVAGVSLKWSLFDGLRRENETGRAVALRAAAGEELQAKTKEAVLRIRESCLRRDEAAARLEVARRAQQAAEETVRLLARRYENSLATMLDLLDAQTALNQARSGLVDAEADYAYSGGRVYHEAGIFLKVLGN